LVFGVVLATSEILDHTPSYKFFEAILTKILEILRRTMIKPTVAKPQMAS